MMGIAIYILLANILNQDRNNLFEMCVLLEYLMVNAILEYILNTLAHV